MILRLRRPRRAIPIARRAAGDTRHANRHRRNGDRQAKKPPDHARLSQIWVGDWLSRDPDHKAPCLKSTPSWIPLVSSEVETPIVVAQSRSEEHTSEIQSLMRIP